jgi:hypothetical protein
MNYDKPCIPILLVSNLVLETFHVFKNKIASCRGKKRL